MVGVILSIEIELSYHCFVSFVVALQMHGDHVARSILFPLFGLVFAVLSALISFASPALSADDGMRLCAMRWGKCTCRAAGDLPGTWTFLPDSRCSNDTNSSTPPAAANNASISQPPVASFPAAPAVAAPAIARPVTIAPVASAPVSSVSPAVGRDQMRLCAVRKGICSCQAPGDGPGQWTEMDAGRCATETAMTAPPAAAPPTKSEPAVTLAVAPKLSLAKSAVPALQHSPKPVSGGFSDCAIRNGLCTCKGPTDNDGQWSLVDGSRCKVILLSNLSSAPASPLPVKKDTTQDVQRMLARLGYDPGSASGQFDKRTEAAIKSFQEGSGMPVDGKMTDLLVSRLRSLQPDTSSPATTARQ
jgi:Putative peptidoglycan binding domain